MHTRVCALSLHNMISISFCICMVRTYVCGDSRTVRTYIRIQNEMYIRTYMHTHVHSISVSVLPTNFDTSDSVSICTVYGYPVHLSTYVRFGLYTV